MRLLVLGGTRVVGRSVILDALERGWDVAALNRGVTGTLPVGVHALLADRTDNGQLREALQGKEFDAVFDPWAQAPRVVGAAARLLKESAARYAYCSSISVYADGRPVGGNEDWPTVEATAGDDATDYARDKRGGELAALESFPEALIGRAGLILGPYEDIGRLPWWLGRAARGGRMVAPGRPDRPLQYVDARDLASWFNDNLAAGTSGIVDLTAPSGHTTTRSLLDAVVTTTGRRAELVWVDEPTVVERVPDPWTQLPCWVPEQGEFIGLMECDTAKAIATGLRSRPVADTVAATWEWLQRDGFPEQRPDRPVHGLPETLETALLASVP
jgi:2'-hydroxyisoflavone reductase